MYYSVKEFYDATSIFLIAVCVNHELTEILKVKEKVTPVRSR